MTTCPECGVDVARDQRFCESCGRPLLVRRTPVGGAADRTRVDWDLGAVVGVSDVGNRRTRNEDAMAFAVVSTEAGGAGPAAAVAVVCDGVATSDRGHLASQAAVDVACDVLLDAVLSSGAAPFTIENAGSATQEAVSGAVAVVSELADPANPDTAPSCTFVSAVVTPGQIVVGWVGDSRAYWLAAPEGRSRRLTIDDTLAVDLIAAGVPEEVANSAPQGHALSRWIGADAAETHARIATLRPDGPGVLLLCSDGLWNYLPESDMLAAVVHGAAETAWAATESVENALDMGGHDNITAVLVPIPLDERSQR
ncbi:protein phosphatase 2C domain-containing protein [Tsukamurella sp. 8F]|uniref:protein phosphatase 2C domain-containing protein n=1 Tax=unclassified Tsukamurella TaxID=2633480 RepID=UPI0023B979B1|nr:MULTISPECIES: protein phosphatase 2C domain-containing protein [unclassified Tsukamurella]MDF0529806.1 protein phosphatase 2C domain-containing protein [Tsukamurella sp. 8J]MDF0586998.1 protein phosphatase 2C domain-containing protein [Tsukamurella sp. 8F]